MPRKMRMKKSTMIKKIITTIYFMYVIFMTSFGEVYSVEWDCTATTNTGTFTRSTDCTISGTQSDLSGSGGVAVSNTLAINGTNTDMNNLITITATTNKRHFYLNNANAKLILRYLKLVGGDVSSYSYPGRNGGSILIYENGGELNLYSSVVYNNKALDGGGIRAQGDSNTNKNAIMNIYNSIMNNNEATQSAGGIYMYRAVGTIHNTSIDNNQASSDGGGMFIYDSDVTMKNTIISNNDAGSSAGGLGIQGDSTTVTLRQSSFINNDATNDGDEIFTYQSPTISLINTYFNNPNNNNNIYELSGPPTWKTCSDNLCTEEPFTGTCNAVNNVDSKLGVLCNLNCSLNLFNTAPTNIVSVVVSVPSNTCKPWQKCDAGYRRVNGNATSDATCVQCGQGKFQPLNQFTGTSCTNWKKCDAGYKRINGNAISDASCAQCSQGQFQPLNQFNGTSCANWKKCDAGYKRVNGNATSDASCVQCGQGQFQPLNQFNGTSCTNWKQCSNNEYISFNGNRTSDRVCVLNQTTTTAAPPTTTAAPTTTTATSLGSTTTKRVITTSSPVAVTTTTSAAPVSVGNTTSAAPSPPTGTTTVAATITATTTTNSARSRSSNTGNGNDEEEELSNSIVNTMSTFPMIIVFMIVIYNL